MTQYQGTITRIIYSNAYIPPNVGNANQIKWFNTNFLNSPVVWTQDVPVYFQKNLEELLKDPSIQFGFVLNRQIQGWQRYAGLYNNNYPFTVSYFSGGSPDTNTTDKAYDYQPATWGKYNINANITFSRPPISLGLIIRNQCLSGGDRCVEQFPAEQYYYTLVLNITATVNCTGQLLENNICVDICQENPSECVSSMISYCFPDASPNDMPISHSPWCQEFFATYIQNFGPNGTVDAGLNQYCQGKYAGFRELFRDGTLIDQSLCACHMQESQYTNFANELEEIYPGFTTLGVNNRCLLPQCASSPYKSTSTGRVCNVPQCINIANFEASGNFDRSNVIIEQNAGCANLTNVPDDETPWWVIIAIVMLVILAILFLYLLFKE